MKEVLRNALLTCLRWFSAFVRFAVSLEPEKVLLIVFAVAVGAVAFFAGLQHYTTSQPQFCLTCHRQQSHSAFWRESKVHPASVGCPECHAKRGELLPRNFSADPERTNVQCGRCHEDIRAKEDTKGFKYNVHKLTFPHKFHLEQAKATCVDCHYNIRHDKSKNPTNRPPMEACEKCHDMATTRCTQCHPKGSMEVAGDEVITPETCSRAPCHTRFREKTVTIFDTTYVHKPHLEAGLECSRCHTNEPEHGTILGGQDGCKDCHHKQAEGKCMVCHGGDLGLPVSDTLRADRCSPCHKQFLTRPMAFEGLTFKHQPHVDRGVQCSECHNNEKQHGRVLVFRQTCLEGCHQQKRPASHTANWKRTHGKAARSGALRCQTCHDKQTCENCHGLPMPHPRNWRSRLHQPQAKRSTRLCNRCHSSRDCTRCHGLQMPHPKGWRGKLHSQTVNKSPTVCRRCHTPANCRKCHDEDNSPESHWEDDWGKQHGAVAKTKLALCVNCHGKDGCTKCHGLPMPHPQGWNKRPHADTAAKQASLCAKCHESAKCTGCHGLELPHPPGWKSKGHSQAAPKTPAACANCHEPKDCAKCHNADNSPESHWEDDWGKQHGPQSDGKEALCALCHGKNVCITCHGGLPMPHPAGWKTRGHSAAAPKTPAACTTCHDPNHCAKCHDADNSPESHWEDDYGKTHNDEAKGKEALCALCHGKTGCAECHKEENVTLPP